MIKETNQVHQSLTAVCTKKLDQPPSKLTVSQVFSHITKPCDPKPAYVFQAKASDSAERESSIQKRTLKKLEKNRETRNVVKEEFKDQPSGITLPALVSDQRRSLFDMSGKRGLK
jgi:hypothetical protein